MRQRHNLVLLAVAGLAALAPAPLMGQSASGQAAKNRPVATAAKKWTPPRTAWGDPDLQGVWEGFESVGLERPLALGDKQVYERRR